MTREIGCRGGMNGSTNIFTLLLAEQNVPSYLQSFSCPLVCNKTKISNNLDSFLIFLIHTKSSEQFQAHSFKHLQLQESEILTSFMAHFYQATGHIIFLVHTMVCLIFSYLNSSFKSQLQLKTETKIMSVFITADCKDEAKGLSAAIIIILQTKMALLVNIIGGQQVNVNLSEYREILFTDQILGVTTSCIRGLNTLCNSFSC